MPQAILKSYGLGIYIGLDLYCHKPYRHKSHYDFIMVMSLETLHAAKQANNMMCTAASIKISLFILANILLFVYVRNSTNGLYRA